MALQNIITFMGYSKQKQTQKATTTKKTKNKNKKNPPKNQKAVHYNSHFKNNI
jgi:hypothetical protein